MDMEYAIELEDTVEVLSRHLSALERKVKRLVELLEENGISWDDESEFEVPDVDE
jgi:hypothetical protein